MTEAEKNEIVGLVMNQISSQAVDFDIETEQPQANDLLTAVRQTSSGAYVGVTIKWDDVARIATELANQAATRAEQAKTNVENMKSSVEQTVTDFNALAEEKKQEVQGVYQSDLNELKGDLDNLGIVPIFDDNNLSTYVTTGGNSWNTLSGYKFGTSNAIYVKGMDFIRIKRKTVNSSIPTISFSEGNIVGESQIISSVTLETAGPHEIPVPNDAIYAFLSTETYNNGLDYYTDYPKYYLVNNQNISEIYKHISELRNVIKINSSDNDTSLLLKMLEAFNNGNTDVFFEKSTYTLHDAYDYMRNVLGYAWTVGIPIGNNCRYYLNGSTIISNAPNDGYSDSRNIFDSQLRGDNYEIYDGTLINNGGRYCIHDEGNAVDTQYFHKYHNLKMIYNNTSSTPDEGAKAFGCGTGYNASFVFENCQFINNNQETYPMAIHGPSGNVDREVTVNLIMSNCYINKHTIRIDLFDRDRDKLEFFLFGNLWEYDYANDISHNIKNNNNTIV